jgi:hypothetical protein
LPRYFGLIDNHHHNLVCIIYIVSFSVEHIIVRSSDDCGFSPGRLRVAFFDLFSSIVNVVHVSTLKKDSLRRFFVFKH